MEPVRSEAIGGDRPPEELEFDDIVAIRHLIFQYPKLIDAGDFDGVADLFRHAQLGSGEGARRVDMAELLRGMVYTYDGGTTSTKHVVSNVQVLVAPDRRTATASSSVTVFQARPDLQLQPIASNRHEDTFERMNGEWRFAQRADFPGLLGDLSHHVRVPYGPQ